MDGNKPIAIPNEEDINSFLSFLDAKTPPEIKENAHVFLNMLRNLSVEKQNELVRCSAALVPEFVAAELKFKSTTESCENPEEIARAKATFDEEVNEIMERRGRQFAEVLNANKS